MKPDEEEVDVRKKLDSKITDLASEHVGLENLRNTVDKFSPQQRKLVLEVLTNGDEKVLTLINNKWKAFLALMEAFG